MNSGHKALVVPFNVEVHPNADKLGIVKVDNYTVCVNKEDWLKIGNSQYPKTAIWVPPDNLVPVSNPHFTFLAKDANKEGMARIRTIKLRQIWSFGFLVPAPEDAVVGDDFTEKLGIKHYEPEENLDEGNKFNLGQSCKSPEFMALPGKYDLEHLQKYGRLIPHNTLVNVFEKVDGCLKDDTEITMSTGKKKKISDVKVGDIVKSFNLKKNIFEDKKVTNKFIQPPAKNVKWLRISLENGKNLTITSNHLVLTKDGYKEAGLLSTSDEIINY